ncbi:MAG: hypothetical protein K0R63_1234 [Rickettsiales bacterium]|nr:hypothetical protein [Rickettsiales bacterium]
MFSSASHAFMKQEDTVRASCGTGDMRFFPPREEYLRMCSALRLESLMPKAPKGWSVKPVQWAIKLTAKEAGFREGDEVRGLFTQYGAYPITTYRQDKGNGRIVVMGTVDANQVMERQTGLQKFLLEQHKETVSLQEDVEYYQENELRASPFNVEKKWFATHVSVYNTAYFVVYAENVDDKNSVMQLIKATDWNAIRQKVKGEGMTSGKFK